MTAVRGLRAHRRGRDRGPRSAVERAGTTDLAFLAMDVGPVPEQFGVVLHLADGADLDLPELRHLLSERVPALTRLRQRLERTPLGCGGPVWVDDPAFDLDSHVREGACPTPGDEAAVLDAALGFVLEPLRRDRPLWKVRLLTGLRDGGCAIVVVLHHVLADGVAGLAVLAGLVDEGAQQVHVPFPRPRPGRQVLARDALSRRVAALRALPRSTWLLRESMAGSGGLHPPRAADCSLAQRTGPRRRAAVTRTDLDRVRAGAHSVGATTNDAVLLAVVRALDGVLRERGEDVEELVVAVPVSGRREASPELGNMVSPIIVAVPTTSSHEAALRKVAETVRAHKALGTGPPPIALLGWAFRPLARLGGYHWYMNHQHRLHTLISHLRGPAEPLHFGGHEIVAAAPVAVAEAGNSPVYFEVLSYAGVLTVTTVVDPDHFAELHVVAQLIEDELEQVAALSHDPVSV